MTDKTDGKTALVIGATGGFGGAVAERLLAAGWRVRALHRDPQRAQAATALPGAEWVRGDAMDADSVLDAAQGCAVIIHGANPPGYRNWIGLAGPMLASTIAAAKATGARIVFPGNVYNLGPSHRVDAPDDAPQQPTTRNGKIRVQLERDLMAAAADGAKALILRMGDFFAPTPGANWLSEGLVQRGRPLAAVRYPGPLEIAHAWAYLPDAAETVVRLLATPLADFEAFNFRGHTQTGRDFVAALEIAAGRKLKVAPMPWFAVRAVGAFNETFREMVEMKYLWDEPVTLDNARLVARLGAEPRTPLAEALRTALAGLHALPQAEAALAA